MSLEQESVLKNIKMITEIYESKKYNECIDLINAAPMEGEDAERMTLLKAMCLFKLEEFERANEILENAMKVNPSQYGLACYYAKCLYHKGDVSASISCCESILISKPEGADLTEIEKQKEKAEKFLVHLKRGLSFYQVQQFKSAIKEFTEALKVDPLNKKLNAIVFYNRGMALQKTRYYKSADADFEDVIKLDPKYSSNFFHEERALILYKIKKYEECKNACEEAFKFRKIKIIEKLHKKTIKAIKKGGFKTEKPLFTSDEFQGYWKQSRQGIWSQHHHREDHEYWRGRENSTVAENDKKLPIEESENLKDETISINLELVKELIEVEKLKAAFFRGAIDFKLYEKLKNDSKAGKGDVDKKKKPSNDGNSPLIDFEPSVDENKSDCNSLFLSAQSLTNPDDHPKAGVFSRVFSFVGGIFTSSNC